MTPVLVRNNDVALVPEGYHPVSSPPGYTTYYLNILAGSDQSLAATDDPAFTWVKETYTSRDPRVPIFPVKDNHLTGELCRNHNTVRLTMAQAVIRFLKNQYSERDGLEQPFFAGCMGIFGHGNVAGIGQALQQNPDFRYYQVRNEQAMVHTAIAFTKVKNRLQTMVCTTSIGPGATNMITGAATATVNRLPVLLLPGDIFARRNVAPVLQQIENSQSQDFSANDCFKPVSKYWDRINRPDQILLALPEAMRVLTSPVDTGAVVLALPEDVQTEAYDYPVEFFSKRVWHIRRYRADVEALALRLRGSARAKPDHCGGRRNHLRGCDRDSQSICGCRPASRWAKPWQAKAVCAMTIHCAWAGSAPLARWLPTDWQSEADLVIGIGTRYSDFTTASKTAFQNPNVKFININVGEFDAFKHHALPVVGDAKVTLEELGKLLAGLLSVILHIANVRLNCIMTGKRSGSDLRHSKHSRLPSQGELIGLLNELSAPDAIMVNAAGSMPGDLHKLWRTRHPKNFHMEYGNSCMGYEIAGGLGVKMAAPERDVYVIVGDGSYLMLSSDLATSVQEGFKLIVILWDNSGYKSIGSLSRSFGQNGFGTRYVHPKDGVLPDDQAGDAVEVLYRSISPPMPAVWALR